MKKNKGFTLIELLVVIAIIGILATIVLVSLNTARSKARDTRRLGDLRQVALALEMYYDDKSAYPGDADNTGCNDWTIMETALEASGTYMTSVPTDPRAGYSYGYEANGSNAQDYVLRAQLENANTALNDDIDGPVGGCPCDDGSAAPYGYCLRP